MVKLKRLKINQYRNVKPGTELHFRDSLNVVLGRNGTGKTTLLDLIVRLLSWNFSLFQEQSVDLEYTLQLAGLEAVIQLRSSPIQDAPDTTELDGLHLGRGQQGFLRHSLSMSTRLILNGVSRFTLTASGLNVTVDDAQSGRVGEVVQARSSWEEEPLMRIWSSLRKHALPDVAQAWSELTAAVITDQLVVLRRFDESLGFLETIQKDALLVSLVEWDSGVLRPFAHSVNGCPAGLLRRLESEISKNSEADGFKLESGGEGVEFLDKVSKLLGYSVIHFRAQRAARAAGVSGRMDFGNIRFDLTKRDGSIINHMLLSYGQKRLLAFYYYLASNPTCVVADELVNGMHHEWIEACLDDLGDRQAFLTSQNPLLLDYLSFESEQEVQSSFVLCDTEIHEDGREQLVWTNMTEQDANGFFKSYEANIQHVSELLRTRGLW